MLDTSKLWVLLSQTTLGVAGSSHRCVPMKLHLLASEQVVDLFQGEVARLRVEEVNQRDEAEVEHCYC